LALVIPSSVGAQDATFRAETTLIEVHAVVVDQAGEVVRGLSQQDFTLLQDGKVQPISQFAFVDLPFPSVNPPDNPILAPDVTTNTQPRSGRAYVLVIDDSRIGFAERTVVRNAGRLFVERYLGAGDVAAVVLTTHRTDAELFTADRQRLLAAIDGVAPQAVVESQPGASTLGLHKTLQATAAWMATTMAGRRRVMVFMGPNIPGLGGFFDSAGLDNGLAPSLNSEAPRPPAAQASPLSIETQTEEGLRTLKALVQADVAVYAVTPAGLGAMFVAADDASVPSATAVGSGAGTLATVSSLGALSEATGGVAMANSNGFAGYFNHIVRESSAYYVLAYPAPPGMRPGVPQSISLRINRPGLDIRARRSVLLPAEPPIDRNNQALDDLNAALNAAVPSGGLRLAVFAATFDGPGGTPAILLGAGVSDLELVQNGPGTQDIDVAYAVLGTTGLIASGATTTALPRRADVVAALSAGGLQVHRRLDLPPGRYQLRLAARDRESGRVGSVFHDFSVAGDGPAMSDVLLASVHKAGVRSGESIPAEAFPHVATATRQFSGLDELAVYGEVYGAVPAEIVLEILNSAGEVEQSLGVTSDGAPSLGAQGGRFSATLPLVELARGEYVLRVTAAGQTRRVPFNVSE
jgi:VWFA-related protein